MWHRLKLRFWPPLVGRCDGVRMINWPAVAMRSLRALLVTAMFGVFLGVVISVEFGLQTGLLAGFGYFGVISVFVGCVIAIRILRGFEQAYLAQRGLGLANPFQRLPACRTGS